MIKVGESFSFGRAHQLVLQNQMFTPLKTYIQVTLYRLTGSTHGVRSVCVCVHTNIRAYVYLTTNNKISSHYENAMKGEILHISNYIVISKTKEIILKISVLWD